MTLRLYDTREQRVRALEPLIAGQVSLYVCGPTVQSSPHIGHLRSAIVYDQLRRWLEVSGNRVTLVRNVTDIDDKVLVNATASEPWWALAYRVEREFNAAYSRLGVAAPTYEPRATGHVPEMIALIERLIERGHAYPAGDGSADVWFDAASWAAYGELTHQRADDMEASADDTSRGKRDPRDFALWKGAKPDEPETASWPSPWGRGRPGWHIECSAMSARYLGPAFDIHGGGLDLRFPHHENELAQSTAAGDGFARMWVHNGLVTVGGQKMSKSLGNSVFAADLFAQATPLAVRYFLGSAKYRSTLEYTPELLAQSAAAVQRIETFLANTRHLAGAERVATLPARDALPEAFADALDDDFNVPIALGVLHERVREGNTALAEGRAEDAAAARGEVAAMLDVLGVNPEASSWRASGESAAPGAQALDALVSRLLEARAAARAEKNWAEADRVRDELAAVGITIEDTASGAKWSMA